MPAVCAVHGHQECTLVWLCMGTKQHKLQTSQSIQEKSQNGVQDILFGREHTCSQALTGAKLGQTISLGERGFVSGFLTVESKDLKV